MSISIQLSTPKLSFGQYIVTSYDGIVGRLSSGKGNRKQVICFPLSQNDYAEGWNAKLPKARKNKSPIHHWSIPLSQLPPHLWYRYKAPYYDNAKVIKDNIYHYTIVQSDNDKVLKKLYIELYKNNYSKELITSYLEKLENINGWIIERAKKLI